MDLTKSITCLLATTALVFGLALPAAASAIVIDDSRSIGYLKPSEPVRLAAAGGEPLMLLAAEDATPRMRANPGTMRPQRSVQRPAQRPVQRSAQRPVQRPGQAEGRVQGLSRDDRRGRGTDDPPGRDDRGRRHGDKSRSDDKTKEFRVQEHGFIGHQFDFISPTRRGADKKERREEADSAEGSAEGVRPASDQ